MKLVQITLFQRLTKVGKPKSDSSECIAPIAYYITNKKNFQVIGQKYFCQMTFFFSDYPKNCKWTPTCVACYISIREVCHSMVRGLISIVASNACATAQVDFQGFENQFWEVPQALKIKRIIF